MIYEIESKNDFLTGASLVVRIPEKELDKKALYTIQADKPGFILPFLYRRVDRQVELEYQIGQHSKLMYLSGGSTTKEYAELWFAILRPLLDCGDWFLNPYSFVLDAGYLYCDKNRKIVSYIYIPSVRDCADYVALKEMAAEVTKTISVADAKLENKVLRAIMKDFSPDEFLAMLESYIESYIPAVQTRFSPEPLMCQADSAPGITQYPILTQPEIPVLLSGESKPPESQQATPGDIVINIQTEGKPAKKAAKDRKIKAGDSIKKEKDTSKPKVKNGLFSRKKDEQDKENQGVAATGQPFCETTLHQTPDYPEPEDHSGDTQCFYDSTSGARLRLIGNLLLPPFIDVRIEDGEMFTVGRFDAAAGKQQSSFEFDKKTKAVSRRHAVIEREADVYSIVDLSSSAGTYINGQRIPPNMPCELGHGCRVAFGNAGAEYMWEG